MADQDAPATARSRKSVFHHAGIQVHPAKNFSMNVGQVKSQEKEKTADAASMSISVSTAVHALSFAHSFGQLDAGAISEQVAASIDYEMLMRPPPLRKSQETQHEVVSEAAPKSIEPLKENRPYTAPEVAAPDHMSTAPSSPSAASRKGRLSFAGPDLVPEEMTSTSSRLGSAPADLKPTGTEVDHAPVEELEHPQSEEAARWIGRKPQAYLGQGSRLLRPPPTGPDSRDPASPTASLPAVYGPGAAQAFRRGCWKELARRSRRRARSRGTATPSSPLCLEPPANTSWRGLVDETEASVAQAEPLPVQTEPTVEVQTNLTSTPRRATNMKCPISHKPMDDTSPAIFLTCGHRFEVANLSKVLDAAEVISGYGFAGTKVLVCPLCGESQALSRGCHKLRAYSNSANAYVGDLRKDWQKPLKVPQSTPSPLPVQGGQRLGQQITAAPWESATPRAKSSDSKRNGGAFSGLRLQRPVAASFGTPRTPPHTAPADARKAHGPL